MADTVPSDALRAKSEATPATPSPPTGFRVEIERFEWPFALICVDGSSWRPSLNVGKITPAGPTLSGTSIPLAGFMIVDMAALGAGRVAPVRVEIASELRWALSAATGAEAHPVVRGIQTLMAGALGGRLAQFWVDVARNPDLNQSHQFTCAFVLALARRCGSARAAHAAILAWYEKRKPHAEAMERARITNGGVLPPGVVLPPGPAPLKTIVSEPDDYVRIGEGLIAQSELVSNCLRPDWSSFGDPWEPYPGERTCPCGLATNHAIPCRQPMALAPTESAITSTVAREPSSDQSREAATEGNARYGVEQIVEELNRRLPSKISDKRGMDFLKNKGVRFERSNLPFHRRMLRLSEYDRVGLALKPKR